MQAIACTRQGGAEEPSVIVVLVEPRPNDLGYYFSLSGKELRTTGSLLDELAQRFPQDERLAVLLNGDVPVRALEHVEAAASKVGFKANNIKFFVFFDDRKAMRELSVPGSEHIPFSSDAVAVGRLFR